MTDADRLDPFDDTELGDVAARLAESLAAEAPPPALRGRLRARLDSPEERWAPFTGRLASMFDLSYERVRSLLVEIADPARWSPGLIPGMRLFHLEGGPRVAHADNGFALLDAGLSFPEHEHLGSETGIILDGAYRDDAGQVFQAGDIHTMPAESRHAYTVVRGPLLFAVSLERGLVIGGREFLVEAARRP
jgi:hypothetical protein